MLDEVLLVRRNQTLLDGTETAALFSADDGCRFGLEWVWDATLPVLPWIMLNPSWATELKLDMTLKRVRHFSRRHDYGGFLVANLYPKISPKPEVMRAWLKTPESAAAMRANADYIKRVVLQHNRRNGIIVAAWGAGGAADREHYLATIELLADAVAAGQVQCLGANPEGWPTHPLARGRHRVPDEAKLRAWHVVEYRRMLTLARAAADFERAKKGTIQ